MEADFDNSIHWVFITDESGMATIFPQVKTKLTTSGMHHVSVVYYSPNQIFNFRRELDILVRHYPTVLFTYLISTEVFDNFFQEHPELESIINANTMSQMEFMICGNEEFCEKSAALLRFLDIQEITIQKSLFI
ncbi:hypothetical protein [Flectobacillus roseus]|uniref:Uncharacterized protein n=1 Tax=Flectobacillus roseus TaxID=502259 RepID=A0ABT6YDT2_9BACT|nr:hypothetical protein [Flectobacillus roseus]MDI9861754.1 hypothetical protein [Flectobacillus roseus]